VELKKIWEECALLKFEESWPGKRREAGVDAHCLPEIE
jgi:hypothetical protein